MTSLVLLKTPMFPQIPAAATIVTGNEFLDLCLSHQLSGTPCQTKLAPHLSNKKEAASFTSDGVLNRYGPITFIRDRQITRLDGTIYIPDCADRILTGRIEAALPMSSVKFLSPEISISGQGLQPRFRRQVLSYVKAHNLPYKLGLTCVEGGNVRLFRDSCYNPKAIIGTHSLIISMLALDKRGFFTDARLKGFIAQIKTPSDNAVRQVRNLAHNKLREPFEEQEKLIEEALDEGGIDSETAKEMNEELTPLFIKALEDAGYGEGNKSFYAKLQSPPTDEDRALYKEEAIRFMAKLKLTKRLIAHELGIPKENVAFLAQDRFHIDEDSCVISDETPGGTVFYHDEHLSQFLLQELLAKKPNPSLAKKLLRYFAASQMREPFNTQINQINCKRLAKIRCRAIPVAAVFEAEKEKTINFMNGFQLDGKFFTNGTTKEKSIFADIFQSAFNHHCPSVNVHFVDLKKGHGMMEFFLTYLHGGINCMTWIYPKQPQEEFRLIKPLRETIEPWELEQLGFLKDIVISYL